MEKLPLPIQRLWATLSDEDREKFLSLYAFRISDTPQEGESSGSRSVPKKTTTTPSPYESPEEDIIESSLLSPEQTMEVDDVNIHTGEGGKTNSGSHSNVATRITDIPKSISGMKYNVTLKHSRIFYTYGYAFRTLILKRQKQTAAATTDLGDDVYHTTSMGYLPNDQLFFYMSPYEYLNICKNGGHVRIEEVRVKVMPLGLRTAFDTGITLSATATSVHCAIGVCGVGINNILYCSNHGYVTDTTNPMIPTNVQSSDVDDMIRKYYGSADLTINAPMCLGIPRHINGYLCLRINSNRTLQNYAKHDEGYYRLDRYTKRFLFNPKIGTHIIDWTCKPKYGIIQTMAHDIPYLIDETNTGHTLGVGNNINVDINVSCVKDGVTTIKTKGGGQAHNSGELTIDYESLKK